MKLEIILAVTGLAFAFVDAVIRTNVTGVLGKSTLLPCTIPVTSYTIEWKSNKLGIISRNRDVLQKQDKFKLSERAGYGDWGLRVFNVSADDADYYRCTAGVYRTKVTLVVEAAPYFDGYDGDARKTVTREAGESKTLTCDAKGIPAPDKTWYRFDQQNTNEMHLEGHGTKLRLSPEEHETNQSYLCIANNTHGHITITYTVKTFGRPTTVQYLENATAPNQETSQNVNLTIHETTIRTPSTVKSQDITKPKRAQKSESSKGEATSSSARTKSASALAQTILASLICYIWITLQV